MSVIISDTSGNMCKVSAIGEGENSQWSSNYWTSNKQHSLFFGTKTPGGSQREDGSVGKVLWKRARCMIRMLGSRTVRGLSDEKAD